MRSGDGTGGGSGRGRNNGTAQGQGGRCVCPSCGHEVSHARGVPCYKTRCPKCNAVMTRA